MPGKIHNSKHEFHITPVQLRAERRLRLLLRSMGNGSRRYKPWTTVPYMLDAFLSGQVRTRGETTVELVQDRHSMTPPNVGRIPVHPGWLHCERLTVEEDLEPDVDEAAQFSALSQLLRTAGALDRAAADALNDLGLTAGAFFALLELHDAGPVGLAPSELARRLAVARRTATLYVDILTRQGWVSRCAHPDDRRMVLAQLTEQGIDLVRDAAGMYKRRLSELVRDLTPLQAERLRQLLTLIPVGQPAEHEVDL
jgi:DNA-binding MarR family transcriptional regulator